MTGLTYYFDHHNSDDHSIQSGFCSRPREAASSFEGSFVLAIWKPTAGLDLAVKFRDRFRHTPLSAEEQIPWKCRRLVVGTGTGALPVMEEVKLEAKRRGIELLILPTSRAIQVLKHEPSDTNAILHVTC